MKRLMALMMLCVVTATASAQNWVTIKGQVVWPKAKDAPIPAVINVTADKQHCEGKGPLNSDDIVINSKNKGMKYVWVYLRPDSKERNAAFEPKDIKPELQKPKANVFVVDQPCCLFTPKNFAIRSGDFVNFKNGSPVAHNVKVDAEPPSPSFNKTLPAGANFQDPAPFVAQSNPVTYSCSIHPWMQGQFMVFDHPYFAVTDDDGNFEIKDAPAGNYRIVYRHNTGYHKGKDGRFGFPITIKAGANGGMTVDPLEFEMVK